MLTVNISKDSLRFFPVTRDRWADFEALFECRGGPHYCWCTLWRQMEKQGKQASKQEKKASMKLRIEQGIPVGIMAYADDAPVAWCSIAPRDTYRAMGGDESIDGVWSLTCFFVRREYRGQGLTNQLLVAAIQYAKDNHAQYVEAYPVVPDSPTYRYMGLVPMFEQAGFRFVKQAGKRRNVMLFALGE